MRVIAQRTIVDFAARHPDAAASLAHWYGVAKDADWSSAAEVQASFSKAKVLDGERVRFEIAGGNYRLIVAFQFTHKIAFIKFVGSHAEYDKVDALTVSNF